MAYASPKDLISQGGDVKKLFLSDTDKRLGGVCGGIAEYMGVDATVVRLVVIVVGLLTAVIPVTVGYIIARMIIPRKTASS